MVRQLLKAVFAGVDEQDFSFGGQVGQQALITTDAGIHHYQRGQGCLFPLTGGRIAPVQPEGADSGVFSFGNSIANLRSGVLGDRGLNQVMQALVLLLTCSGIGDCDAKGRIQKDPWLQWQIPYFFCHHTP